MFLCVCVCVCVCVRETREMLGHTLPVLCLRTLCDVRAVQQNTVCVCVCEREIERDTEWPLTMRVRFYCVWVCMRQWM